MDVESDHRLHRDLRRFLLLVATFTMGGGAVAICYGWIRVPEVMGFAWICAGVALVSASIPLWNAQEWARVLVGSVSAAITVAHVAAILTTRDDQREFGPAIASVAYAVYFLLPSTRAAMREAREAMERGREARRRAALRR